MKKLKKPLLVGEQNPYGGDDTYALYPVPEGCAGQRLCYLILGMWGKKYLDLFDRCNLVEGPWSSFKAKIKATELLERNCKLILFGAKVCQAFGETFNPFSWNERKTILILPHPSGRNRIWDNQESITKARNAMIEFYPKVEKFIGQCDEAYRDG